MPPCSAKNNNRLSDSMTRPNEHHVPSRRQILGFVFASPLFIAAGTGTSVLFCSGAHAATSPQGAADFVQWLADQALKVLRSPNASMSDRERILRELLASGFDLKFIGRFVLGRTWRKLSPAQRDAYIKVYSTFFLNTYSARFGGYNGQKFTVLSARGAGKKDAVVKTRIDRPGGAPLTSDWRIRANQNEFRIIDISVEGVSMAVTQRSEFASVIKNSGIEGLMAALRARTDKMPVMTSN
jgi:phospholipid transport system substrate-binding protein